MTNNDETYEKFEKIREAIDANVEANLEVQLRHSPGSVYDLHALIDVAARQEADRLSALEDEDRAKGEDAMGDVWFLLRTETLPGIVAQIKRRHHR